MTTKTLSLSELNEAVTETQEAKPTRNPNVIMQPSPGGYWKSWRDLTGDLKWRTLYQFTADVGAIHLQRLIAEKELDVQIHFCGGDGIAIVANAGAEFDCIEENWPASLEDDLLTFEQFAPALCCAYLFCLDGIRRDVEDIRRVVEDIRRDGGEGGGSE